MTKQEELIHKHPKILGRCYPGVGDGWVPIIDKLCSDLQKNVDEFQTNQVVALQIKERFGGLRFYVSWANEEQRRMIYEAEHIADRTCEVCGECGEARTRWCSLTRRCRKGEGMMVYVYSSD